MESRLVESPFCGGELRVLTATALEALAWTWEQYGTSSCVLSSMQDATIIELATRVHPDFPIVFLDTGYHFDETWDTLRAVEAHYGIDVEVVGPLSEPSFPATDGQCCADKPRLLDLALDGRKAWVSGIRRSQTDTRAQAPMLDVDRRGVTKVNPIAQWSDDDHAHFVAEAGVIRNPLLDAGYTSIGCAPCTSPPTGNHDPRSGRWAGTERTECGLHL